MPVTKEHIRDVAQAAVDCVTLAFGLYRLFDPFPSKPDLVKKRKDILKTVGDLQLFMLTVIGGGLREFFGIANARAGRAERIEIDRDVLSSYHDYAVYLLGAVTPDGRKLPLDRQRQIEEDIWAEAKRALAWLDLASKLEPSLPSDDASARLAVALERAEIGALARVEELIYGIKGLMEEYQAIRAGGKPHPRVSLEERRRILGKRSGYLRGGAIAITPQESGNNNLTGKKRKRGAPFAYSERERKADRRRWGGWLKFHEPKKRSTYRDFHRYCLQAEDDTPADFEAFKKSLMRGKQYRLARKKEPGKKSS